jgi:MSHA pilin protein MshA
MITKQTVLKKNRNSGFTLINLIIIIIISGVLAAVVKPKFIDLSSEAKIAILYSQNAQFKLTVSFYQLKPE